MAGVKGIVSFISAAKQAGNQSLTYFDIPNGMGHMNAFVTLENS